MLSGKQREETMTNSPEHEDLLDDYASKRDNYIRQIADREAGKPFFAPPGRTVDQWTKFLKEEIVRYTEILKKEGRQ
jgi:hypothetical protein